jgi:hypothetical protein
MISPSFLLNLEITWFLFISRCSIYTSRLFVPEPNNVFLGVGSTVFWTPGLTFARLYQLSYPSSPLCFSYFSDRVSCFCLGSASDHNPPRSASQVAVIIGTGHCAWLGNNCLSFLTYMEFTGAGWCSSWETDLILSSPGQHKPVLLGTAELQERKLNGAKLSSLYDPILPCPIDQQKSHGQAQSRSTEKFSLPI